MKTLPTYDPTLFEGAAEDYARYRAKYPPALFAKLAEIFHFNNQGRLLDLGCSPGLMTIPLQSQFQEMVAVDPDPEMLKHLKKISRKHCWVLSLLDISQKKLKLQLALLGSIRRIES